MSRIEEIHKRLPNTHLVMHGSSSVPQDLQDIINKYGGKMKQTFGVPVEEIQRGIKSGFARSTSTLIVAWPSPAPSANARRVPRKSLTRAIT